MPFDTCSLTFPTAHQVFAAVSSVPYPSDLLGEASWECVNTRIEDGFKAISSQICIRRTELSTDSARQPA